MANNNRQQAKNMAAQGASAAKIERKTGVTQQAAEKFVAKAAAPAPGPNNASNMPISGGAPTAGPLASGYVPLPSSPTAAVPQPNNPSSLGQVLKIAGGGGGVSKGNLLSILDTGKKDAGQIVNRLDKINANLKEKGKTGINLKSGAVNYLTRQASKARSPFSLSPFGTGALGSALTAAMGDPGSPGYMRQGQLQGERAPVERTVLARGMDLMPGGRQTVRGIGKQYEVPERLIPKTTEDPTTGGDTTTTTGGDTTTTTGGDTTTGVLPPEPPPEEAAPAMPGSGLDAAIASWATGFKSKRSSRKGAGRRAQGVGSMKMPKTNTFGM